MPDSFAVFLDWLVGLDWQTLVPEFLGKALGFLFGFAASWYLLFRRKLQNLQRLQLGDSDDLIYQAHWLIPSGEGPEQFTLVFRNLGPRTTLNRMYDNPAASELVKDLADRTTLADPILETSGSEGFEVVNDAVSHIAGLLAVTPFPRETWLCTMTCEDRQVVRKKCVRCFLIRPEDLRRFVDWNWCLSRVHVEKPWHWFRIVALHCIAKSWQEEQRLTDQASPSEKVATAMPLVDKQMRHNRVRELSLGLSPDERPVGQPYTIPWQSHLQQLQSLGLALEVPEADEPDPPDSGSKDSD